MGYSKLLGISSILIIMFCYGQSFSSKGTSGYIFRTYIAIIG